MLLLPLVVLCIAELVISVPRRVFDVEDEYDVYNIQRNSLRYENDHYRKHDRRLSDLLETRSRKRNNSEAEYAEVVRFKKIESNLTQALTNLSSVLNQILNLVKFTKRNEFRAINDYIPNNDDRNGQRIKRSTEEVNNTVTEKITIDNTTEVTNTSGRRTMNGELPISTVEVRNKLFTYIEEGFNEILFKVRSLLPIKTAFNNDAAYKIGYIVANIDTLNENMKNLKTNMDSDKYNWNDYKILNLYDTIKMSNAAVTNLLDVLKNFLESGVNGSYK